MDQPSICGSAPHDAGWAYWRPALNGFIEFGALQGQIVRLRPHFHVEDQITFVVSGRRTLLVGGEVVALAAGEGVLIPAGVVHRSLAEPIGVSCVNANLPEGKYNLAAVLDDLRSLWWATGYLDPEQLAAVVPDHWQATGGVAPESGGYVPTLAAFRGKVSQAAARAGMSREGFTRMFARRFGAPPHAFQLMMRLNDARDLLRAGQEIAAAAVETGFADQSHFGRCFRRAFGVTPGRYRSGGLPQPLTARSFRPGLVKRAESGVARDQSRSRPSVDS